MLKSFGISGNECEAELKLLHSNSVSAGKILWFYGEKNPEDFSVIYENRTSSLLHNSGKRIMGAEHLSAAVLAFSSSFILNTNELRSKELPLLDGSAKLWVEELEKIGATRSNSLYFFNAKEKEFEIKLNNRFVKFGSNENANGLKIKYIVERFGKRFSASVNIKSAQDLDKILLARTFIFEEELQTVKLPENLQDCGVVLNGNSKLRFENEPAYHKILDFLGDITLYSNALPNGQFEIFNGGHELHHIVLKNM